MDVPGEGVCESEGTCWRDAGRVSGIGKVLGQAPLDLVSQKKADHVRTSVISMA